MDVTQPLIGGFSLVQILAGTVGLFVVLWVVSKLKGEKRQRVHPKQCSRCNWKGAVTLETKKCPSCGARVS